MGRDGQYHYDESSKEFLCNCTDWQVVTALKENKSLLVTVFFRVYRLIDKELSFNKFYKKTQQHKYESCYFAANCIGVSLPCEKCTGNGQLDWIQFIMNRPVDIPETYERNPYGGYLKFVVPTENNPHILHEKTPFESHPYYTEENWEEVTQKTLNVYASLPYLRSSNEYCPKCHGNGMRELSMGVELVNIKKELT